MAALIALLSGIVFGFGLLLSGMTEPAKVKAFLDIAGAWDPSLAFVMGGAIAVAVRPFAIARRGARAWSGDTIDLPQATRVDRRLVAGGLIFGLGWGLAGYCPGPALVALGGGSGAALWFVIAMLTGVLLHDKLWRRSFGPSTSPGDVPAP